MPQPVMHIHRVSGGITYRRASRPIGRISRLACQTPPHLVKSPTSSSPPPVCPLSIRSPPFVPLLSVPSLSPPFLCPLSIRSPSPLFPVFLSMGRRPWATPEQTSFLEGYLATLERDKQDKSFKDIYATVAAKFIEKWTSPLPRGDKFEGWTPARLKSCADDFRRKVSLYSYLFPSRWVFTWDSRSPTGSRSVAQVLPLPTLSPRLLLI